MGQELYERVRVAVHTASFVLVRGRTESRAGSMRLVVAENVREVLPREVVAMPDGKSWG